MKYTIFLNGERGFYILKKILKEKKLKLNNIIYCKKEIKSKLRHIINLKKTLYIKNINKNKSLLTLKKKNNDLFIIAGYPQIFASNVLKIPKKMTINLHGGPIPKYRGGSPLNWQIINDEKKIGISILEVNKKIDGGKLIEKTFFSLNQEDDIKTVHKKANYFFYKLLKKALTKIRKKKNRNLFLNKSGESKYWHQRKDIHGELNYKKKSAKECFNFIRAITKPYPGAWIKYKYKKKRCIIRLFKSRIMNKNRLEKKIFLKKKSIYLPCKDNFLKVTKFQISYDNPLSK